MKYAYRPKLIWNVHHTSHSIIRTAKSINARYKVIQTSTGYQAYYIKQIDRKIGIEHSTVQKAKDVCEEHHFNKMMPYLIPIKLESI